MEFGLKNFQIYFMKTISIISRYNYALCIMNYELKKVLFLNKTKQQ
jgi:hypothetical protein